MNTADGARAIYSGPKTNIRKAPFYKFLYNKNAAGLAALIDKTAHARKRHITSQGFSDAALKSQEPYMIANIQQWCDLLGTNITDGRRIEANEWTEAKNMSTWSNYLTFDVLGDLCFGKPFGLLTSSAVRYVPRMMLSSMYAFQTVSTFDSNKAIKRYDTSKIFSHAGRQQSTPPCLETRLRTTRPRQITFS
jgi:hypothetical protein